MKKSILFAFLLTFSLIFVGCDSANSKLAQNNTSEITEQYYFGQNENYSISVSVGRREEPYMMDGFSNKKVDFSLIILKDKTQQLKDNFIQVTLFENGDEKQISLQYNPLSGAYMYDLGYKTHGKLEFQLNGLSLTVEKQNFAVTSGMAFSLACKEADCLLVSYKKEGKLFGECYLKILGEKESGEIYWCFTFLGVDLRSFNLIISTSECKIVSSDL